MFIFVPLSFIVEMFLRRDSDIFLSKREDDCDDAGLNLMSKERREAFSIKQFVSIKDSKSFF